MARQGFQSAAATALALERSQKAKPGFQNPKRVTSLRNVSQGGRRRLDALLRCDFQGALQSGLNLARRFLSRVAVGHDAGPLHDLSNEAVVTWFRAEYQIRIS